MDEVDPKRAVIYPSPHSTQWRKKTTAPSLAKARKVCENSRPHRLPDPHLEGGYRLAHDHEVSLPHDADAMGPGLSCDGWWGLVVAIERRGDTWIPAW